MNEAKLNDALNETRGLIGRVVAGAEASSSAEPIIALNKAHDYLNANCNREVTSQTDIKGTISAHLSVYRLPWSQGIICASKN